MRKNGENEKKGKIRKGDVRTFILEKSYKNHMKDFNFEIKI